MTDALTIDGARLINLPGRPAVQLLDADGRVPLSLKRPLCELMDRTINTLPLLGMRWELVCEICVQRLGRVQRRGDPSPDIFLNGAELPDGTVEMTALCAHARRTYRGPYAMPGAVIRRPLHLIDDGSQGGPRTYALPKAVQQLIVKMDRALREQSAQMRLFCTICEEQGRQHREASVRGDNQRHGSVFRLTCAHAVRLYS